MIAELESVGFLDDRAQIYDGLQDPAPEFSIVYIVRRIHKTTRATTVIYVYKMVDAMADNELFILFFAYFAFRDFRRDLVEC